MSGYIEKAEYYNKDTPERAVAGWIENWGNQKWGAMADYIQITWLSKQKDPQSGIKGLFFAKKLKEAHIIESTKVCGFIVDVKVRLRYTISHKSRVVEVNTRVLRETGPYLPSVKEGKWGINPISTLREVTPA
jgi:hypothetical protein